MKTNKIILNGKTVDAVVFGDGQKQIDYFTKIEKYTMSHQLKISGESRPAKIKHVRDDILCGEDKKYTIIATHSYIPNTLAELSNHQYASYIKDKTTGQIQTSRGTISKEYFELLTRLKEMQK